jgi:isoleucyl-tRNA synthetase
LSARYFDIIKDRLYTAAPRSLARRSAQTALYRIADALSRLLSPILVFTSDEIWENLPKGDEVRPASVHMAEFPQESATVDSNLLTRWAQIFEVRDVVLRKLEEARAAKTIGSSLEARVKLSLNWENYDLLKPYQDRDELRYIFIVSQTELSQADLKAADGTSAGAIGLIEVEVERAEGKKCERCWNYSVHVGESERYPSVCERCAPVLVEIEGEQRA